MDIEKIAQSMSEIDTRVFMYMFENKSTLEKKYKNFLNGIKMLFLTNIIKK